MSLSESIQKNRVDDQKMVERVAMKMPMPSIAARPLINSAFSEKTSLRPADSYAFMTEPLSASGK